MEIAIMAMQIINLMEMEMNKSNSSQQVRKDQVRIIDQLTEDNLVWFLN